MNKIEINSPITSYRLVDTKFEEKQELNIPVLPIKKNLKRPEELSGKTYKIKSPLTKSALYVTINNILDDNGKLQPFEIFCYSKDNDNYQWITALTRMISAVFRRGGDLDFVIEELSQIAEPGSNGYIAKGGKYIPSIVAEIGLVIKKHFEDLSLIEKLEHDDYFKEYLSEKKEEYLTKTNDIVDSHTGYPSHATVCPTCNTKAMIKMDNCLTCLQCGDSKCG